MARNGASKNRTTLKKAIGPYPIVKVKSSNAVKLGLPKSIKIHPVVNVSNVRPFKPSTIPKQSAPQPVSGNVLCRNTSLESLDMQLASPENDFDGYDGSDGSDDELIDMSLEMR